MRWCRADSMLPAGHMLEATGGDVTGGGRTSRSSDGSGPNRSEDIKMQIDELMRWMPETSQSIVVAQGPADFDSMRPRDVAIEGARPIQTPISRLCCRLRPEFPATRTAWQHGLLFELDDSFQREFEKNRVLSAAMILTNTRGEVNVPFGIQSHTCQVEFLSEPRNPAAKNALVKLGSETLTTTAGPIITRRVYGEPGINIYVANPRPSIMMVATDAANLKTIIERMINPHATRVAFRRVWPNGGSST